MTLSVRDERTLALVRQLADATGQSPTAAVHQAVEHRLAALGTDLVSTDRDRRNARVRAIVEELHRTVTPEDRDAILAAADELYDESGLPV